MQCGKYDYVSENYVLFCRFGIFPSWGLSQKLSRIIGPNRAREISLSATPILADQAERWGLVNHVVEGSQMLIKARQVAEAIIKNNQDLVLKYKAVINDGFKQDLSEALKLEKVVYIAWLCAYDISGHGNLISDAFLCSFFRKGLMNTTMG